MLRAGLWLPQVNPQLSRQALAQGRIGDRINHLALALFDGDELFDFGQVCGLAPGAVSLLSTGICPILLQSEA